MTAFKLLIASVLLVHLASASPQFIRFPLDGRQPQGEVRKHQQSPVKAANHTKHQHHHHIDPVVDGSSGADDIVNTIRGARQVVSDNSLLSQFPRIYKVDDFIIIANPKVRTPPPCVPAPQPMFYPTPPRPAATPSSDDLINRMMPDDGSSSEPSRCVWAIVACCSPGSRNIRYSCFELLGCPGAFWDLNPCEDRVVMAAANSALQFYTTNTTATPAPSGNL